jgi:hypothetical protein
VISFERPGIELLYTVTGDIHRLGNRVFDFVANMKLKCPKEFVVCCE